MELKAIDAAIVTAKQNLAAAKANESRAAEKLAAIELRGFAKQLREAGEKCDAGLLQLAEGADEMKHAVAEINARGLGNPSAQQLQSLGERAIRTALMDMPWARAFEPSGATS